MPTFYDRFVECASAGRTISLSKFSERVLIAGAQMTTLTASPMPNSAIWPNPSHAGSEKASTQRKLDQRKRIAAGSRLAIVADNDPRWVATFLGIIASGCAAVPLDTTFHADQLGNC